MPLRADTICHYYLCPKNAFEGVSMAQEFLLSNAFSCWNFPNKILKWILWQNFFFRLKTYLLGYGKIDFEGILGVPFFYGYSDSSALCFGKTLEIDKRTGSFI